MNDYMTLISDSQICFKRYIDLNGTVVFVVVVAIADTAVV